MATAKMNVNVSFPGIEDKPAPVRSLANFFMENSSLYFRKNSNIVISHCSENHYYDECATFVLQLDTIDGTELQAGSLVAINGTITYTIGKSPYNSIQVCSISNIGTTLIDGNQSLIALLTIEAPATEGSITYYGVENLTVTQIEEPSVNKSDLEEFAENHNINLYNFTYELASIPDNGGSFYTLTLTDGPDTLREEIVLYISGYISNETDPGNIDVYSMVSRPIVFSKNTDVEPAVWVSENMPSGIIIDSVVLSEKPLVELPAESFSCNIKLNNDTFDMQTGHIISINYDDKNNSKFKPTAEQKIIMPVIEYEKLQPTTIIGSTVGPIGPTGMGFSEDNVNVKVVIEKGESDSEEYSYSETEYFGDVYISVFVNNERVLHGHQNEPHAEIRALNNVLDDSDNNIRVDYFIRFYYADSEVYYYSTPEALYNFKDGPIVITLSTANARIMKDGVIESNTALVPANTQLSVNTVVPLYSGYGMIPTYVSTPVDDFIKIPVKITPTINDKINYNENITPDIFNVMEEDSENEDSEIMSNGSIVIVPISSGSKKYDFQLRTTSFIAIFNYLDEEHGPSYMYKMLYYKVGICPKDGSEDSLNKLLEIVKNECLTLKYMNYDGPEYSSSISIENAIWNSPYIKLTNNKNSKYPTFISANWLTGNPNSLIKNTIISLIDSVSYKLAGVMYLELCNNDGSKFDESTLPEGSEFGGYLICDSENAPEEKMHFVYSNEDMYISFKTEKINGGFIASPQVNTDVPSPWVT